MKRVAPSRSLLLPSICFAGARHFTFLYEAPTSPPGSIEMRKLGHHAISTMDFTDVDFRQNWSSASPNIFRPVSMSPTGITRARATDRGAHLQEFLTRAHLQPYESGDRSDRHLSLRGTRRRPPLLRIGNETHRAEELRTAHSGLQPHHRKRNGKRKGLRERNGEIQQALGASYEITPRLSVGAEMLHEMVLPEWHTSEAEHNFFIGPNVSYRGDRWFATVTALAQTTTPKANLTIKCASSSDSTCERTRLSPRL